MQLNKALFLDRDGVINVDHGYTYQIEGFSFIDGIFDVAKFALSKGFLIIIVTNQSGIGRGYYTLEDFKKLSAWMELEFKKQNIEISKIYYCPHHVDALLPNFKLDCECRKPKPGMILEAIKEFNIDPTKSILIGDKETDIEAAINAKIGTKIYFGKENPKADYCYDNHNMILDFLTKS